MKIEICESLLFSWLKYEKECQLVQTNWKAPTKEFGKDLQKRQQLKKIFDDNKERFFASNVKDEQFFKQAEADIVGFNFSTSHLYFVDTAFHENGLGYSNNVERVVKKTFRNALLGLFYFSNIKSLTVIFATPKVKKETQDEINLEFLELKEIVSNVNLEIAVEILFIGNSDFLTQIIQKTTFAAKKIADTSDLFIRGAKLMALFETGSVVNEEVLDKQNKNDVEEVISEFESTRDSLLLFFPNEEKFIEDVKRNQSYYVAEIFEDRIIEVPFVAPNRERKSSWRNIILSKAIYRKDVRENKGILRLVAFSGEEQASEINKIKWN